MSQREGSLRYWQLSVAVALNAPLVLLIILKNTWRLQLDALSWIYLVSVSLGYYLLAIYIVASLAYLVLSPFKRLAAIVAGLIVTTAIYYLLVDSYTYAIVKMHIDLFWLTWIFEDFAAFGLSPATMRSALFALLALIAIELGIIALVRRIRRRRYVVATISVLLPLLLLLSQAMHALAYESNDVRITGLTPRLPFYQPLTSHRNAVKYEGLLPIGESKIAATASDRHASLHYPLRPLHCNARTDSTCPNILVLFLESWRHEMLNDSVTPQISHFARRSTQYLNHFSSGNSTIAGVFGFFYGLHPTYWPAVKAENVTIHNPVLLDLLTERNYAFGIFARSNFKRHKIKDAIFRDIEVHEDFVGRTPISQDADMTERLIDFIAEQGAAKRPFFGFAFYKSNHASYRYPTTDTIFRPAGDLNLMGADVDTDPTLYLNDYRNATHYVDRLIGDIIDSLDSLALMDNTIVIITTDHGEEFNDTHSNSWGHTGNYTRYQTQVPLVLYVPSREPDIVRHRTTHIDVVPTLLHDFLGCTNEITDYSNGQSLFGPDYEVRPLVIGSYVNHAFIIGDNVFEVNPFGVSSYKLDDLFGEVATPPAAALETIALELRRFFVAEDVFADQGRP